MCIGLGAPAPDSRHLGPRVSRIGRRRASALQTECLNSRALSEAAASKYHALQCNRANRLPDPYSAHGRYDSAYRQRPLSDSGPAERAKTGFLAGIGSQIDCRRLGSGIYCAAPAVLRAPFSPSQALLTHRRLLNISQGRCNQRSTLPCPGVVPLEYIRTGPSGLHTASVRLLGVAVARESLRHAT